jgi:polysaccharide biosynthesis transport protein
MEHQTETKESRSTLPVPGRWGEHTLARTQYVEIPAGPAPRDSDDEEQTPGLIEYWRILRRHKGTWIVFAFVGALLGFLITLPQTPIYQARTSVEIVGLNDNFLNFKQSNPMAESGTSSEALDIQTQVRILESESLLDRVSAKLGQSDASETEASPRVSAWRRLLNLPEAPAVNPRAEALKNLGKSLKVHAAGQTRVIEITADSPNPQLAEQFANTLTNEFIEQNLEARWKTTERTSNWLARQLDGMKIKLEQSEGALQTYARNSGLLFTEEKTNVSEDKLRQLQQELSAAQGERIARQSRYEIAQTSPPDALPDVLNDPGLRDTQSKITELRRQVAELSTTFTPEHAKVKRAQAELSTLEAAFNRDRAAILDRIKNEYQEAGRKEKLLAAAYDGQTRLVTGQSEKAIQYNILKREADSNRQLYEAMLQQLKESTIASAMRASNVRVVDPAKFPLRPYKPNPVQSAALGLLAGIFIGAASIMMRERANRTIQQPGEISLYLNVPELGIIPSGAVHNRRSRYSSSPSKDLNVLSSAKKKASGVLGDRVELVTWQSKPSMVAEGFRSTLVSILFAGEKGPRPKILVLTSAGPAEGKSTVASNLGIAIAEVGQRVLLIDADMRKPRQHEIFALNNDRGLSSILRDKTALNGDKSLGGLIRDTEVPGLFVLTSGPTTSSATSLLYGLHMSGLLSYVRTEFDTVLIDTPPMLQMPDARVLGRMADKVIMVIRSGHTTKDAGVAAAQRFSEDGTKILGTILNDWNPRSAPNGYYGYYSKYYSKYYKPQKPSSDKIGV